MLVPPTYETDQHGRGQSDLKTGPASASCFRAERTARTSVRVPANAQAADCRTDEPLVGARVSGQRERVGG